jgi:allantoate deiminase
MADARVIIERCRALAQCTEEPGFTTRTFLSAPMREVHALVRRWMEAAGMCVRVDAAGNIRGCYEGTGGRRLYLGSHLDTVPRAGAFDGVLGVVMAVALVERLAGRRLPFAIEVVGFSEEEGVRYGVPFIGSRALTGDLDEAMLERIDGAIRDFGLDPAQIAKARATPDAIGYFEFHIEQGPVLESLELGLGVVEAIAGQSRFEVTFRGEANHAALPMAFRRDALAGAAEWIGLVEREALAASGLVATVGRIESEPGAGNVIAGTVRASLDVRHRDDAARLRAQNCMLEAAREVAARRGLEFSYECRMDRAAVKMDGKLVTALERAVAAAGHAIHRMASGAGHDAMIMAARMPAAMLFLRSPGGISHHPNESVREQDVAAALEVGLRLVEQLEGEYA